MANRHTIPFQPPQGTFLDKPEDIQWLRETHLKNVPNLPAFKSAIIVGNEDCPERIVCYKFKSPRYDACPVLDHSEP